MQPDLGNLAENRQPDEKEWDGKGRIEGRGMGRRENEYQNPDRLPADALRY